MNSAKPAERVRVVGKFLRLGPEKFYVKGVTYGPFAPNADGEMFPTREQADRDLKQLHDLGANLLRLYYVPPRWFLDLLHERGLKVLVDIPWAKHLCFLDSATSQAEARRVVREAVLACKGHPALFAFSVVNEVSAEVVRWSGVKRVERFMNELIFEARAIDPDCLYTFTSFPPTEYLQVENADFVCFNVYLHDQEPFTGYLARLQTLADAKPLVLGEFGMDSIGESEAAKCEFLTWQIEQAFRSGLAGTVVFSYTDDWYRGGMQIEDWGFGLTTRDRQLKESFGVVRRGYLQAPFFPLPRVPMVSVVVATYNGGRTLPRCLESLTRLRYPNFEIILVDDGSTDRTPEIAKDFPDVRYLAQTNQGLSAARNAGIRAAKGEIIAFTDDDCEADEDWLYYLVGDLLRGDFAGIGGHNFLPPDDSSVAAAIMAAPGGPAHVLITDTEAEHVPGCNMAFYKWALEQVGMFDPVFSKAGDDVDICWRLQDSHIKIGFSASGFVWHHRRTTVRSYLKQQTGYGEAEALLIGKHPEHYSTLGGGIWRGHIYSSSLTGLLVGGPAIYHGVFGSAFFQRLYAASTVPPFLYSTSLGYHVFVNLPLLVLAASFEMFLPLAAVSLGISLGTCALAALQARLARNRRRFWSRPLVALLFFLQPIVRGWSRFTWRITLRSSSPKDSAKAIFTSEPAELFTYWVGSPLDRLQFLHQILDSLEADHWLVRTDTGWTSHDLEVIPSAWVRLRLATVTEELEMGKRQFRCRLTSHWSLWATALAALTLVVVALAIWLLAASFPWTWFSLLLLPLIGWYIADESSTYKVRIIELINRIGEAQQLVPIKS